MNKRIITLVRHGKVDGPAALYGNTDIGLSNDGLNELQTVIHHVHRLNPITHILSSPLIRCAQPAREFSRISQLPLQILDNLKEMHFGEWDGVPFNEFNEGHWQALNQFWETPSTAHAPHGEPLQLFAGRVIHSWQQIQGNNSAGHQLVICHGGVIRIIIAHLLNLDWTNASLFRQLTIDYASNTRIEIANDGYALPIIRHIGENIR